MGRVGDLRWSALGFPFCFWVLQQEHLSFSAIRVLVDCPCVVSAVIVLSGQNLSSTSLWQLILIRNSQEKENIFRICQCQLFCTVARLKPFRGVGIWGRGEVTAWRTNIPYWSSWFKSWLLHFQPSFLLMYPGRQPFMTAPGVPAAHAGYPVYTASFCGFLPCPPALGLGFWDLSALLHAAVVHAF